MSTINMELYESTWVAMSVGLSLLAARSKTPKVYVTEGAAEICDAEHPHREGRLEYKYPEGKRSEESARS